MSNQKFRAVVLKKEAPYNLDQTLADDFGTMDIHFGPKADEEGDFPSVAGVVEDCWYNKDIIADVEIMDEEVAEKVDEGILAICPTIAKEFGDLERIEGLDLFLTPYPDEEVVGEVTPI